MTSGAVARTTSPEPEVQEAGVIDLALQTSNLDEIEDVCQNMAAHRLTPLTRNVPAKSWFRLNGGTDFGFFNLSYGRSLISSVTPQADDRITFLSAVEGVGEVKFRGEEFTFSNRMGGVLPTGGDQSLIFTPELEIQLLFLSRSRVEEHCSKLLGRSLDRGLDFDVRFSLETASGSHWQRLIHYAAGELAQPDSLIRYIPAARQQLEQMLITAFLLGQRHTYSEALLQPQSAAAPYYVKRAEAYIEAHFHEPLSLSEIAASAGVSARSLQNGFHNFRGMTPMAFLRRVRLQNVRKILAVADPKITTVTEVALSCGFTHLGEFGTLYKRTFGVTPRQTLLKVGGG